MTPFAHNMLVVKGLVTAGFVVYVVVPPDWQWAAGLATNLIWLWRT